MITATMSMRDAIAAVDWLETARNRARITLGPRAGSLEQIARKLAKETPYRLEQWWPRVLRRMCAGERVAWIYSSELDAMRETHRRGGKYLR